MTTGPIFQITFLWVIIANNGVPTDHGSKLLARYIERDICADTPEQALQKFRDWYCRERNGAVYATEKEYPKGTPDHIADKFKIYWPQILQITSIIQGGTIIT